VNTRSADAPPLAGEGAVEAGELGGVGAGADELQLHAVQALISKPDREVNLEVTGFETIPKIDAQKWQHDLL